MSESAKPREKKKRLLTREQQAMWRRDNRAAMKGKPKEEKRAAKEKLKSKLQAMSEGERATLIKDLQAKWDALPAAEKQALEREEKNRVREKRKGKKAHAAQEDDDE
ncbi:MAG TPA: hypothetical protein VHT03_06960 [Rhizomicrobium sp.]|jgi:hypothetical protein|nr:hypothetical protein [Rhizomicrobium sp.]